ncbi:hypothetical protein [Micromonospora aurantiaca]|uniref:Uncharacterized protein n=1 Tax=Micromonospora aurantiaca (nom. illeg.) TaxID=47850 RepID=A0A6N3JV33_9ACTN|nr:hypothetical protein [Micromonospora aurantiaca]AXH88766.1 hypothetical protein DVH21_01840 [Micromonospora aurantiaca]
MTKTRGKVRISRRRHGAQVTGVAESRRLPAGLPVPQRLDPAVAARLAGARARHAPGLDYVARLGVYQEQNGPPYRMTDRQHRRVQKKLGHQEAQARRAIDRRAELAELTRQVEGGAGRAW